jgi:hypothetical protein
MTFSCSDALALVLRRAWSAWKQLARRIGEFNSRVVLTLLYAVLVIPVGLILRLVADPLRRRRPQTSNWTPRVPAPPIMDEARRQ